MITITTQRGENNKNYKKIEIKNLSQPKNKKLTYHFFSPHNSWDSYERMQNLEEKYNGAVESAFSLVRLNLTKMNQYTPFSTHVTHNNVGAKKKNLFHFSFCFIHSRFTANRHMTLCVK